MPFKTLIEKVLQRPIDLLLVQIPNLPEQSYLVGVASLKAYLNNNSFSTECYNPVGDFLSKHPEMHTPELKAQFSNGIEYGRVEFSADLIAPSIASLIKKIETSRPKYLGFSIIYGNITNTMAMMRALRKKFPDLKILLGGPGLKVMKESDHEDCVADFIIHDEGELTIKELLILLNNGCNDPVELSGILGLEYRVNGAWRKNAPRPTVSSLKDFCIPDYSDFENDPCAKRLFESRPLTLGRGCPFRCRFCAVRNYGSNYRHYEIEDLISYLKIEVEKGHRHFMVHDPITNGNPHWIRSFCEALIRENLNITWGGSIRLSKYLNETKTLDLLFESGFRAMVTGLESAAPNVLKHMKKFDNMEIVNEIFEKIRNFKKQYPDIKILLQLIVGYPNETEADFQMTLDFVKNQRDVISEIVSCSSFLMIQGENDDLMEMTRKREFGLNVITEANWASVHSSPLIRKARMKAAEQCFKDSNLPYNIFYDEHIDHIDLQSLAQPVIEDATAIKTGVAVG